MPKTADGRRRGDRVLHADFSTNLVALDVDALRTRRREAEDEEQELSYVRRLLHGRIDILKAELRRRAGNGDYVMASLPQILADAPSSGRSKGRHVSVKSPDVARPTKRAAERAAVDAATCDIGSLTDHELRRILDTLSGHERGVSDSRGQVHRVLDRLTTELTRRYRDGTARVDDLLDAARRS